LGENSIVPAFKDASTTPIRVSKADAVGSPLLLPGKDGMPTLLRRDKLGVVQSGPVSETTDFDGVNVFQQALLPLSFDELSE
jgi:hypothetical protein